MKVFLSGFFLSSAIFLGYIFFIEKNNLVAASNATQYETAIKDESEEIKKLRLENLSLKEEMNTMRKANKIVSQSSMGQESSKSTKSTKEILTTTEAASIAAFHEELRVIERAGSGTGDFGAGVAKKFSEESVDSDWSRGYEQKIQQFIKESPTFNAHSPQVIECRSSRCKMTFLFADSQQMETASKEFVSALQSNNYGLTSNSMATVDHNRKELSFYIAKDNSVKLYE